MAITRDDILFAFDAGLAAANGGVPVVGGEPTFERSSSAYRLTRNKQFVPVVRDTPRFQMWPANDGNVHPVLWMEQAATNEVDDPFDPTQSSWNGDSNIDLEPRTSVIEGETAYRFNFIDSESGGDVSSNYFPRPPLGDHLTVAAILESSDATETQIQCRNPPDTVLRMVFRWSDLQVIETSGQNSDFDARVVNLGRGPNGGQLVMAIMTGIPDDVSTNNTRVRMDNLALGDNVGYIFHGAWACYSDRLHMPFSGTIAREDYSAPAFAYQDFALCFEGVIGHHNTGSADNWSTVFIIGRDQTNGSAGALSFMIRGTGNGIRLLHRTPAGDSVFTSFLGATLQFGDRVVLTLAADNQTARVVGTLAVNGVDVGSFETAQANAMSDWLENAITLGAQGVGSYPGNCGIHRLQCVRLSAIDSNYDQLTDTELREAVDTHMRRLVLDGQGVPL